MNEEPPLRSIELVVVAMAGATAVAVNSGGYDLNDNVAVGSLLIFLYTFGWRNDVMLRIPFLFSIMTSICLVLVFGVVLDDNLNFVKDAVCAVNHPRHAALWLVSTLLVYAYLKLFARE